MKSYFQTLKIKRNTNGIGLDIAIAPLIDIVFLLLIFFMLITRFLNPAISLDIPKSNTSQPTDTTGMIISISSTGDLYFNDRIITLENLSDELKGTAGDDSEKLIRIRADKSVEIQRVIEILDKVRESGFSNIALETKAVESDD